MDAESPRSGGFLGNTADGNGNAAARQGQDQIRIAQHELAKRQAHPFYQRVNELTEERRFDEFTENEYAKFYTEKNGRTLRVFSGFWKCSEIRGRLRARRWGLIGPRWRPTQRCVRSMMDSKRASPGDQQGHRSKPVRHFGWEDAAEFGGSRFTK